MANEHESLDANDDFIGASSRRDPATPKHQTIKLSSCRDIILVKSKIRIPRTITPPQNETNTPEIINDIVPLLLSYCDAQTLCQASCVSHLWRSLASRDEIWEQLCKQRFGVSSQQLRPPPDPTKLLYILTHRNFRKACRGDARNPFTQRCFQFPRNVAFL